MWKQMLLQVIVALLPLFVFQIWYDRSKSRKGIAFYIAIICGFSMLLGIAASSDINGYDLDFRFAPFIVGSLYGGVPTAALLTIVYIVSRLATIHGMWEWLELAGVLFFFVPVLLSSIKPFQESLRKRKYRIVLGLTLTMLIPVSGSLMGYLVSSGAGISPANVYYAAAHLSAYMVTIMVLIKLTEDYIEKLRLAYRLHKVSNNYRIEVEKLQQFIEETPLGVIFVNQSGIITQINEMAIHILRHKLSGKDRVRLIGEPFTGLYDNVETDTLGRLLYRALGGHQTSSELVQEQGKIYMETGICVRDMQNNDIIGAAIIAHDITELNRLRDEIGRMERLSLVGQMAASITHEIRNPMAVIRGFVQLMRERSPEHHQQYFQIVMEELDRANSIIDDFLSLAQDRILEKESCSLQSLINDLFPLLVADANMRGLTIELNLDDRLPPLMLNEKEMKQLILNLARNGMEAMDQNGVLQIATSFNHGVAELRVKDNGCGIPKEKLERLFEPFYTTKSRGTGLGLPLCLSIVERHGGQIRVESAEGQGTTFIVSFEPGPSVSGVAAALEE
ncbi:hypothetical protein KZ483_07050 [Paenibacillus sp. sptzw28]|uniref:two-component system sensor histidine kinase NtrB n=1 Tax=Paenibacillus sp. sptzw28 TaxID=715179 RepID=UPI001C6E3277|nr:ATP-binding protein [Paenibacillus sp. sptzw28]QYR22698.1 hypothetical protein KZ483_07050 [Paenibacillus sp. sptzw28]